MFVSSELLVSITSPSFVCLHLQVSVNVLPGGVYCCFTRTTLHNYCGVFIDKHMYTKFHFDWKLCQ